MKKQRLLIPSLGLPLLIFLCYLPTPDPQVNEPVDILLTYGGRPGCWGTGPCRIQIADQTLPPASENQSAGVLELSPEGQLLLKIKQSTMTGAVREQQFSKGLFHVPADFEIPAEILQALGINAGAYRWKRGDYPVVEQNGFYHLVF